MSRASDVQATAASAMAMPRAATGRSQRPDPGPVQRVTLGPMTEPSRQRHHCRRGRCRRIRSRHRRPARCTRTLHRRRTHADVAPDRRGSGPTSSASASRHLPSPAAQTPLWRGCARYSTSTLRSRVRVCTGAKISSRNQVVESGTGGSITRSNTSSVSPNAVLVVDMSAPPSAKRSDRAGPATRFPV